MALAPKPRALVSNLTPTGDQGLHMLVDDLPFFASTTTTTEALRLDKGRNRLSYSNFIQVNLVTKQNKTKQETLRVEQCLIII